MPIDQYSPCPCGSGKKIKFCKCVEQPQDYEKLLRLMEGGQEIACMDRINQMLAKTPNAAWLLALKGELALGMNERETFSDTANRFLKLRPDNPQALVMKALACLMNDRPLSESANYLLSGLAETREQLSSLAPIAIDMMLESLLRTNKYAFLSFWGELQQHFDVEYDRRPAFTEPIINLQSKQPTPIVEDPPGAPWKERLAEVLSLTRSTRFSQAETKLRSILRDYPDSPGPTSHILRCQVALIEEDAAVATVEKLIAHPNVSERERVSFQTFAIDLVPSTYRRAHVIAKQGEIESADLLFTELSKLPNVSSEQPAQDALCLEFNEAFNEEILPKYFLRIFDKPLRSAGGTESDPSNAAADGIVCAHVATLAIYGKETDKPARAAFTGTARKDLRPVLDEVLNIVQQYGGQLNDVEPGNSISDYTFVLHSHRLLQNSGAACPADQLGPHIIDDFLQMPMKLLGNLSPLEAAADESKRVQLLALLRHFEGIQSLVFDQSNIGEMYHRLGLERPAAVWVKKEGEAKLREVFDLCRIEVDQLSDEEVRSVFVFSMKFGALRTSYELARTVQERSSLNNDAALQIGTLGLLRSFCSDTDKRIQLTQRLIKIHESVDFETGVNVGSLIVELLSMLSAVGRTKEAQETLSAALQKHGDDPYLLSFLQYINQMRAQSGGYNPEDKLASRIMQHGSKPASQDSGLFIPGQSNQPQGESKLWLPGT